MKKTRVMKTKKSRCKFCIFEIVYRYHCNNSIYIYKYYKYIYMNINEKVYIYKDEYKYIYIYI